MIGKPWWRVKWGGSLPKDLESCKGILQRSCKTLVKYQIVQFPLGWNSCPLGTLSWIGSDFLLSLQLTYNKHLREPNLTCTWEIEVKLALKWLPAWNNFLRWSNFDSTRAPARQILCLPKYCVFLFRHSELIVHQHPHNFHWGVQLHGRTIDEPFIMLQDALASN